MSGSIVGVFMLDSKSLRNLVRHLVLETVSTPAPEGKKKFDPVFFDNLLGKLISSEDLFVDYYGRENYVKIQIVRDKQGQEEEVIAFVDLVNDRNKPCLKAWEVASVISYGTPEGWGRLLYDIAMEKLGLIMSDRESVSSKARAIWDSFAQRSGEIERVQLDDIYDSLTPGYPDDNCAIAPYNTYGLAGNDYEFSPDPKFRNYYFSDSSSPKLRDDVKAGEDIPADYARTKKYYERLLSGPLAGAYRKKGEATPVLDSLIRSKKFREK